MQIQRHHCTEIKKTGRGGFFVQAEESLYDSSLDSVTSKTHPPALCSSTPGIVYCRQRDGDSSAKARTNDGSAVDLNDCPNDSARG